MTTLNNPNTGQQITVPEETVVSYTSRGWVRPGTPAPAERTLDDYTVSELRTYASENDIDLAGATLKADIRAAIDQSTETVADDTKDTDD